MKITKSQVLLIICLNFLFFSSCVSQNNKNISNKNFITETKQQKKGDSSLIQCNKFSYNPKTKEINYTNGELLKKYKSSHVYFDKEQKVLIIVNDKNYHFTFVNLCEGKEFFEISIPFNSLTGFYQMDGRYFVSVKCEECLGEEIWEFEIELERIMTIDLKKTELEIYKLKKVE